MFIKTTKQYLIIWILNRVLILYVSARPIDNDNTNTISDAQLKYLAESVCSNLENIEMELFDNTCRHNFKGPDPNSPKLTAPIDLICQMDKSVRYRIEPSENWQLIVLVPELGFNETEDYYFITSIIYKLIEPNTEYEKVSKSSSQNYTVWTAELIKGVPHDWRGGDYMPLYEPAEKMNYNVDVQFYKNEEDTNALNAYFSWNITDGDKCFDVANSCDQTGITPTTLWPKDKGKIQFDKLTFNDECDILITGIHGTGRLVYHTPNCSFYNACLTNETKPEFVKNISVVATEDSPDTWKVVVKWAPQDPQPDAYNVTLWARHNYSVKVNGNETKAVVTRVKGTRFYHVSVSSIKGNQTAHKAVQAYFPARGSGAGAAAGVLLAAAACLLLCCCRRRAATPAPMLQEELPVKEVEDMVMGIGMGMSVEDMWEVKSERLLLHEVVGEGAFGVVRRATYLATGQDVAVKMLKDFPSLEEVRSFRSEMELMKSVGVHPHIVSLVGCCAGRRPFIIAEYCSRGDLLSYLRCSWDIMLSKRNVNKYYNNNIDTTDYRNDIFKRKPQMENPNLVVNKLYEIQDICDQELTALDLLSFCRQIAMGMEYLAANRVVHRDLAARNVLVTADRTLKIADFGLSRDVYEENQYKQKGNGKMPIKWMAIESLTRRVYTTQSDVWSFGVVLWEVATLGGAPYVSVEPARLPRLLRAGYRMPRPLHCSEQLYDVMASCWREQPRARPTFSELHARLDDMLHAAADTYLSLTHIDDAPPPPPTLKQKYFNLFLKGKRSWSRGESYERPLKPPRANHYTSPPAYPLTC